MQGEAYDNEPDREAKWPPRPEAGRGWAPAVLPVGGRLGAEIAGLDLAGGLDPLEGRLLQEATVRHGVVFLRGQLLSEEQQEAVMEAAFGEVVKHPSIPPAEGSRMILEIKHAATAWHSDMTYLERPPAFTMLRSVLAPAAGGDTIWASTTAAARAMPDRLLRKVGMLRAVHSNVRDYSPVASIMEAEHPILCRHPRTGEASVCLGLYARSIPGLGVEESMELFRLVQEVVTSPEHTVRWRWQPGDVAIWDNRSTQHRGVGDHGLQARVLRRSTAWPEGTSAAYK